MRLPVDVALADLARVLTRLEVGWFLFGAQAAILYGSTRVTEDIDVTVTLLETTTRKLVTELARGGLKLRVKDSSRFVEQTRVVPVVHAKTSMPVDIVLAGPGLEELFLARARPMKRGKITIPVASPEDLIVMKLLAGRPHDLEDIRSVMSAQEASLDVALVKKTLRLLEDALGQSDLLPLFETLRRPRKRKR